LAQAIPGFRGIVALTRAHACRAAAPTPARPMARPVLLVAVAAAIGTTALLAFLDFSVSATFLSVTHGRSSATLTTGVRQASKAVPGPALETRKVAASRAFVQSALGLGMLCAAAAAAGAGARSAVRCKADKTMGYRIGGAPGHPGSPHHWIEPIRWIRRFKKRIHIRKKIEGTCARPRMAIFRSKSHMHVNVVDDTIGNGITLVTSSTLQRDKLDMLRQEQGAEKGKEKTWTIEAAEIIGREVAKKCLEKNITAIVFDRGGFPYDGRVKALAEAARSAGLQF